jgi:hypothetical protein
LAISAVYTGIIRQISEKVEGGIVILLLPRMGPLSFKLWHKFSGETSKKLLRETQG